MVVLAGTFRPPKRRTLRFPGEAFWLFGVLFPVLFGLIRLSEGNAQQANAAVPPIPQRDSFVTVTLTFVGDLMCHSPQYNNARKSDGSYDFVPSFEMVKPYFEKSDFVIGNLETTTAGASRGFSGYPAFNTPDEYVAALKASGFDMLATANNHSMDTGEEGLQRTISIIKKNNLSYTGTFASQHDRDSIRIVDLHGVKVGVLNYTYGTNGAYPSSAHSYMLNVYDSTLVKNDAAAARAAGADIVLVFYHWGVEYRPDPMWPKQDTMMRTAIAAGADLIIGSHPHVIGPVTFYKGEHSKVDSGLVAWTMGNFISNQSKRTQDAGLILTVELTKNVTTGEVKISKTTYVPTWVYRGTDPSNKNYVVLPAQWGENDSLPSWINADSKAKMKEAYGDTKTMVNRYSNRPQVYNEEEEQSSCGSPRNIVERPGFPAPNGNGHVALTVQIDWRGNVMQVSVIAEKTTTSDPELLAAAKQRAYKTRYNAVKPDCPMSNAVLEYDFGK